MSAHGSTEVFKRRGPLPVLGGLPLRLIVLVTALAILASPLAAPASASTPAGCSRAPLALAAQELVHPDAEVLAVDEGGALVLAPLLYPGVTLRLVAGEGLWCDAMTAFNVVSSGTPIERASAYARVAAAPWFDGVEVTDASETAPGVVTLTTHARTNGIVARWDVVVDDEGIRSARWSATAFAVAPFEPSFEGLTALPGATRAYVRGADGLISPTQPILVSAPAVETLANDRMSDGFRIQFHVGGASGFTTGIYPTTDLELTTLEIVRSVTRENYEEFLAWGLQKGWTSNLGHVYLDDDTAASCLACVFISQQFQIHISSGAIAALQALGYSYPDDRAAWATVIGHEMFHNFQNAYYKPEGNTTFVGGAFSEGLARFQETLHGYSEVSHQPESLVHARDANGCNDELGAQTSSPTLFDGPSTGQSYSACDFWLSYYGRHGIEGVEPLLVAAREHRTKTGWNEIKSIVESANGAPLDDDLAAFAAALLTGQGLAWGPASGPGPVLDWSRYLDGWDVPTMEPGGEYTRTLRDGGMMAALVLADGTVATAAPSVRLYVIDGTGAFAPVTSGTAVDAPAWIVAIAPGVGTQAVTLAYA